MILRIGHGDANLLALFLTDVLRLRMPKKYHACLARLKSDVRTCQINSDRFNHALPIMKYAHASLHTLVAQTFKWNRIARWKRWCLLPALAQYCFFVWPAYVKARGQLNKVAVAVKAIEARCSLPGGKG